MESFLERYRPELGYAIDVNLNISINVMGEDSVYTYSVNLVYRNNKSDLVK